jgi:epoxyqueuosine reductase
VPALGVALADAEPLVRSHAAWALGRIGGQDARRLLATALTAEQDEEVRAEIKTALDSLTADSLSAHEVSPSEGQPE